MKKILFGIVALSLLAPVAQADYNRDLLKKAHAGDVESMRKIGIRQFNGAPGTLVNRKSAIQWLEKAASNNDADALYFLGNLYLKGTYVGQNQKKAGEYLRRAADKGHEKAIKKVIAMPLDVSLPFVKKKAESGDIKSCFRILEAYMKGEDGLSRNKKECLHFFKMAKDIDSEAARKKLQSWPLDSAVDIWEFLADKDGDQEAVLLLAEAYDKGDKGVDANKDKAKKYYEKAAASGNQAAELWMKENGYEKKPEPKTEVASTESDSSSEEPKRSSGSKRSRNSGHSRDIERDRELMRKAYVISSKKPCYFLSLYRNRLQDVNLSLEDIDERTDFSNFFLYMRVSQKVSDNRFLVIGSDKAPISVRVPENLNINFADDDEIYGIFIREGDYSYETVSHQHRTVRSYVIILGTN